MKQTENKGTIKGGGRNDGNAAHKYLSLGKVKIGKSKFKNEKNGRK